MTPTETGSVEAGAGVGVEIKAETEGTTGGEVTTTGAARATSDGIGVDDGDVVVTAAIWIEFATPPPTGGRASPRPWDSRHSMHTAP